ncbi:cytochrome C [Cecembia sp.]|uniref:cytochrome C n=1 Tax=Cecembia sp. TaxID=1898110 RepID=UPI0025B80784|nr:cytochrome C [Cecembia sp.]
MKEQSPRKILVALAGLAALLVVLVLTAIVSILLLYTEPEWLSVSDKPELPTGNPVTIEEEISEGVHVPTGFKVGEGLELVIGNCTNCHSAKLVTQNRFTKEGWINVIRWMQETQGLWDLGTNEESIVAYLSTHYAPEARGRRKPLEVEWYDLE